MKRLQKTEFILTYMIIITLACFIGGFFLGAGYMKSKITAETAAEAEAAKEKAEKERMLKEQKLYKDQDFVRFYYSIYLPASSVKTKHFELLNQLSAVPEKDQLDLLKEMEKYVEEQADKLEKPVPLESAPLLIQATAAYQHALQAYLNTLDKIQGDSTSGTLHNKLAAQTSLFEQYWLQAESSMYHAVATWDSVYATKKAMPAVPPANPTAQQWQSFPFHYRVYLAADTLARLKMFQSFSPLDLTARIDSLVDSGQIQNLAVKEIPAVVRVLEATDAVRTGDYLSLRGKLYSDVKTPEMPIYTE